MFWVFLEVVAALAVAIAIVWWTWPKKEKPPQEAGAPGKDEPPQA